jgi:hypothetical protein
VSEVSGVSKVSEELGKSLEELSLVISHWSFVKEGIMNHIAWMHGCVDAWMRGKWGGDKVPGKKLEI